MVLFNKKFSLYQLIYLILVGMNLLSFPGSGQAQNWFLWTKQYTENARKTLWHFLTVWLVMQTVLPFFFFKAPNKSKRSSGLGENLKFISAAVILLFWDHILSKSELLFCFRLNPKWRVCISIFHSLCEFVYTPISTSGITHLQAYICQKSVYLTSLSL